MKNVYVVMANSVIDLPRSAKAYISLIGVFDSEEKAKQGIEDYSRHHVADEHASVQDELATEIAEVCQIKMIEVNKMHPDFEFDYEVL